MLGVLLKCATQQGDIALHGLCQFIDSPTRLPHCHASRQHHVDTTTPDAPSHLALCPRKKPAHAVSHAFGCRSTPKSNPARSGRKKCTNPWLSATTSSASPAASGIQKHHTMTKWRVITHTPGSPLQQYY